MIEPEDLKGMEGGGQWRGESNGQLKLKVS